MYTAAQRLAAERRWVIAPDGAGFRRVVASPEPREILEARTIALLVDAGVVVICAGGGIPVVCEDGRVHGVEAVVDKDLAANVLAQRLSTDVLLMLTDVDAVEVDWGLPSARLALTQLWSRSSPYRSLSSASGGHSAGPVVA